MRGNDDNAPGAVIVSPNCAIYPLSPRTVTKQRWSERTLGLCGLSRSRSIRRSPASYAASDNDSSCEFRSRNCKADSSSARSRSRWTCRRATSTPAKPVAFNSETIALGGQKSAKSRVSPPGNRRNTASRLTPADNIVEREPAAAPQHAKGLAQHARLVAEMVEGVLATDEVEAARGKWQRRAVAVHPGDIRHFAPRLAQLSSEPSSPTNWPFGVKPRLAICWLPVPHAMSSRVRAAVVTRRAKNVMSSGSTDFSRCGVLS